MKNGTGLDALRGDSHRDDRVTEAPALIRRASQRDSIASSPDVAGYGDRSIRRARHFVAKAFARAAPQKKSKEPRT